MNSHTAPSLVRLERFAWMVALLVLFRVLAWDLHHALDQHVEDGRCEICLVMERAGDAPAAAHGQADTPLRSAAPCDPCGTYLPEASPRCPLPRGPPALTG
jgi:hypothetical protein